MVGRAEIKAVVTAEDRTKRARSEVQTGFRNMVANVNTALMQVGNTMNMLGNRMSQSTNKMIEGFAGFDQAMTNTISIAQGTEAEFEQMRQLAQDMSKEIPVSAEEIANGFYTLASAGEAANRIIELTPDILKLATATASDFDTTAKVLTSTLAVFGETGLETDEAMEILMNTVKGFKTTLPELADSLKFSGASASVAGVDFATLSTATGILRNNYLEASQAGTAMRMMLSNLIAPSGQAKTLMEDLGFEVVKTATGNLDLVGTMRNLNVALENTDPVEKFAILNTILGQRAVTAGEALMSNVDALEVLSEEAKKAGLVEAAFTKQLEGAQFQLDISKNKMEEATLALTEQMIPAQIKANEATADFLNWLSKLPSPLIEVGGAIAVLAGKVFSSVGSILQLTTSMMTLITLRGIHATAIGAETTAEAWNTSVKAGNAAVTIGFTTATIAQTGATEGATIAQWAYNAAVSAFPAIAIIAGVAALGIAMKALADHLNKTTDAYKQLETEIEGTNTEIEVHTDNLEELNDTLETLQDSYDNLGGDIDEWSLANEIAKQQLKDLNELLEEETDEMKALSSEIQDQIEIQEDLENQNRNWRLDIEENNLAIKEQEDAIAETTLGLQSYRDAISEASAGLNILTADQEENRRSQSENNLEIAKLGEQLKPLERRRKELMDKQKDGINLNGAEKQELAELASGMAAIEKQILSYRDANDVLRISTMELALDVQDAKTEMKTAEQEYAEELVIATEAEVKEINKLKASNSDLAETILQNTFDINSARDTQLDKEKELADAVVTFTEEEQALFDELTETVNTNNEFIDANRTEQLKLKIQIDETTESIDAETDALIRLNAELEKLQSPEEIEKRERQALADAYADLFLGGEKQRVFEPGEKLPPPEGPIFQGGADFIQGTTKGTLHHGEAVLVRESANVFRELVSMFKGGAGRLGGTGVTVSIGDINISHPDSEFIATELDRTFNNFVDKIRNERIREG